MTIYDAPASVIKDVAEELKKIEAIKPPDWARFVKTGGDREKKPENVDWWYVRSASILRKIRIYGPVGIPTLRRKYGGKKNRGHNPEAMRRGSGAVIRNIIHQLEKAELLKKTKEGRVAAPKGIALLDRISHKVVTQVSEVEKDAGRPGGVKEEKAARAPAKAAGRKGERRAKAAR
jgi:small subunit ribosomal protein S19e